MTWQTAVPRGPTQTQTDIYPRQDTVVPMGTRYPKPTPVNPAPREKMATRRRPPGVTPWGEVNRKGAGVPYRRGTAFITLN